MILDHSPGNVEVIGDVKEFKSSIDPKNLEFITTLLSSNLYSDPEQSFIREIVSNAWDSHVEAGTTDTPVIIRFKDTNSEKSITIRDFGTGLSPERFNEIYRNIGSSTKRDSNDYIGGFGIGHLSPFACSNSVYITSYYNGTAYYYVGSKLNNTITYHLLFEKPTTEKNGVEITIKNILNLDKYNKALQFITFFPNIYIDGADDANYINNAKLKRFKNFAAASIRIANKLLLGNVLYPCAKYHFNYDVQQILNDLANTGIVIKFDVGELNITPNRESIIYNSETIKKIASRAIAAKKELGELIKAKICKDYDNIIDYCRIVSKPSYYDPVSNELTYDGYRVTASNYGDSITYNKHNLVNSLSFIKSILSCEIPSFRGIIHSNKIYRAKVPYYISRYKEIQSDKILIINDKARIDAITRSYLDKNYYQYCLMTEISKSKFNEIIRTIFKDSVSTYSNADFIIDAVYDAMMAKAKRLDLNSDPDFLKYKASCITNKTSNTNYIKDTILYVFKNGWKDKKHFSQFSTAVKYIKELKKGILLTNMDSNESLFSAIAAFKGYIFIKARKDIVSELKKMNLKCLVDEGWVTKRDKTLSIVKTLNYHFPDGIDKVKVLKIAQNIPDDFTNEFIRLAKISEKANNSIYYRSIAERDNIPIDSYTNYLCLKLKDYIAKYMKAEQLVKELGISDPVLTTAVIIKTKAYRVSSKAYNKVKNNKLLNILCRK